VVCLAHSTMESCHEHNVFRTTVVLIISNHSSHGRQTMLLDGSVGIK
jgi:hypothetical protein